MTKYELHKATKQFVYQIIMSFKEFDGNKNISLINEIVQSATRLSAHCRYISEKNTENEIQKGFRECKAFLAEIIYLLNLLNNTNTYEFIKTEELIFQAFEIKQSILNTYSLEKETLNL